MKRIPWILFLLALPAFAQMSNVTATLTDSPDGVTWVNGTCSVKLLWSTTKYPTTTPYRTDTKALVPQNPSCAVNSSGVLSTIVTDVAFIFPPKSTWQFTVCPNVYQGNLGCGVTQVPVTGNTVDLTGTLSVPSPRVGGGIASFAYSDLEVAALWNNFYWNTTSNQCRQWQGSWAQCASGGGGTAPGSPPTSVQYNNGGVFAGDQTFTFNNSTKYLNLQNQQISPLGTAQTGTNFNSGTQLIAGSYCSSNPCNPMSDFFSVQNILGTGVNPTSTLTFSHSGSSGAASGIFNYPLSLPTGSTGVTQSPGDNTRNLATDAFVLANAGGNPGGSNTQVQYNNSPAFGGDPTFTFNNSTKTLGFQNGTIAPLGTANSGANFNSGIFQLCDSYWTGSAPAPGCWSFQATPLSGTNPFDILTVGYTGSPSSGQINFPFSRFNFGFGLNAGNGSNIIQFKGPANLPTAYSLFWPDAPPTSGNTLLSCAPGTSSVCTWAGGTGGALAVTPQQFGGFGDGFSPPDGFNTTASSTTVTFTDGSLISTAADGGKDVWISGAGASGVAFHSTIVTVTDSSHAVVAAAPSTTASNAHGVYGHDDTTAIQSCLQFSSVNSIQCFAVPAAAPSGQSGLVGFLVNGALQLVSNNSLEENSGPNLVGSSQSSGTNFFCENNGDCLNLASGPIQGASVSNIDFQEDPSQPNSRGIHLNPQAGTFGNGPFTNSNFYNVNVDNPAKECLWMDGGGGVGYAFNLPNQYVQFTQFWCNGPNQSHPANLILMTGQAAQIVFINGQVNGQAWSGGSSSLYPNPLIKITEKTSGLGDTPVDVKFYGYTFEVGTQGLYIGNGANNIHYDNSYVENISTPFIVTGAVENTFNGNHIANSGNIGAVYQFAANSQASVRDTLVYGGAAPPAAWAVCTGNNQVVFDNNNSGSGVTATTGCATTTGGSSGGSMTLVSTGTSASITEPDSAPISTISAPGVAPGKTLTLYGASGFQLASGGNISLGGLTSPVRIPSGGSATLTLMDSGVTFLLTSATGTAPVNNYFYADQYSGADASVKINACITSVIAAGGGTCDARNFNGTQTMSTQINVGGGSGNLVSSNGNLVLLLPLQGVWNWNITDGTSCGIMQYTNTTINGLSPGGDWAGLLLGASSGSTNMDSLYCTQPSPTEIGNNLSNVRAEGFVAENFNAGTFANGLINIQSVSDQALFYRIGALNWTGDAWHVKNACCAVHIDASFGDSGQPGTTQAGGNVLTINGGGNGGTDLIISNSSFNGPGASSYNVYISPTANTFDIQFLNDYFEKYGTNTSVAMIYNGADAVNTQFIGGQLVNNCSSSCVQYAIENHSTQGFNATGVGFGFFSSNGINDIANSVTYATDGNTINQYMVGTAGSGNSYFQRLQTSSLASIGPSPTFAATTGTGSLATGSTNVAGVINSTVTGTFAFNFTWANGTGGVALYAHRGICKFTNDTTPADVISTTSATGFQLFATGTTVSGDVVTYLCSGY